MHIQCVVYTHKCVVYAHKMPSLSPASLCDMGRQPSSINHLFVHFFIRSFSLSVSVAEHIKGHVSLFFF